MKSSPRLLLARHRRSSKPRLRRANRNELRQIPAGEGQEIRFTTQAPPQEGSTIEIEIDLPEELTGRPDAVWVCKGLVVDVRRSSESDTLAISADFAFFEPGPAKI